MTMGGFVFCFVSILFDFIFVKVILMVESDYDYIVIIQNLKLTKLIKFMV